MMVVMMMVVMVTNDNYNLRRQRHRCSEAEHECKPEQNPFHR